ncbi:hypothetical protein BRADI_1g34987v3 [Brachypodium distachyon]|uniref:Uncharacterized protein n=1 Tax=Brachypodium distachyon TaxID=15368 RepID=A0A2K2DMS1_BRADI|nr:hypothetical protein BRADI_1g34987v3 [Brachypodium distachyon]
MESMEPMHHLDMTVRPRLPCKVCRSISFSLLELHEKLVRIAS